ncbi:hypothetical protein DV113_003437 [Geotrichum candidum]|uniref:Similar to Saccharomyces cerevisiae YER107C GLE2 Component of the Nup82 subcomplex of the nuclear pore complex n=1 Tax=Geotrichum candidum TaxID=1173061 RepID=A0A0J9XH51_GEOCN|nr:hypothetical protein DV113_003437 [Geotrichum candidum]CDO56672.1 similar to Saccharomyces cerevisiae YER107C GLE2 Component of the Nup82 subcomplex of the nuclear pore complex [Geotrichum candidum]
MALFGSTSSSTATNTIGNSANDRALSNPPEDSVSDISFSPQADFLAVASWDSKVRIYEIAPTGESQGRAMFEHQGPVLSARWSPDGTKVVSAGCDNAARLYDLQTQQSTQVAVHDAPIKSVRYVDIPGAGSPMIATASWDKTLKYWDTRQQQPISTVTLPERAYTMDTQKDLLVVGTAERHVCIFNLNNPGTIFKSTQSPLKWQTRVISCYPNGGAYAIGSIEGRCGIQYVDDAVNSTKSFSFKCHRQSVPGRNEQQVYALNSISIHPTYNTISTAGGDGTFHFWDTDSKHRLKGFNSVGGPITSTAFNRNGSIFAYAISYDWSKGYQQNTPQLPIAVKFHATPDEDVKPRLKKR